VRPRTISGTQNFLPYFTDASNDLGNSVMQQSSGSIGIGTVPGAGANTTPSLDLRTYPFSQIGMAQTVDYLGFFSSDIMVRRSIGIPGKTCVWAKRQRSCMGPSDSSSRCGFNPPRGMWGSGP